MLKMLHESVTLFMQQTSVTININVTVTLLYHFNTHLVVN